MTMIKVLNTEFTLSSMLVAKGVRFPNTTDKDRCKHNKYLVTIITEKGISTINFYDSHTNWKSGVTELTNLQNVLECFLSEACAGDMSFNHFCGEFGYDDIDVARKVYRACQIQKERFDALCNEDLYDITNALNEQTNATH